MDASRVLFWGVEVSPGKPIPFELNDGEVLYINMASLGETLLDKAGRSVITASVGEQGEKYALCALTAGKIESFNLDLTFAGEEKVVLEVSGRNTVHLVGNFGYEGEEGSDMFGEDEDANLINEYSDDESQDADDSDVEPMLLPDDDPPVITEIKNEAGVKVNGKASKKGKGKKPVPVAVKEDEGDDDDDDESEQEAVGRTKKKAVTPEASKSGGKKRASTMHAGQTPASKKARHTGGADGSGPSSAKKQASKKGKVNKEQNGGSSKAIVNSEAREDTPSKKSKATPLKAEIDGSSKKQKDTPAKPDAPEAAAEGEAESGKKRKRRRKSKGSAGSST